MQLSEQKSQPAVAYPMLECHWLKVGTFYGNLSWLKWYQSYKFLDAKKKLCATLQWNDIMNVRNYYFLYSIWMSQASSLKRAQFLIFDYFKQERELGTMGALFSRKSENNYILKLCLMKHFFNKSHWCHLFHNLEWTFCNMKWKKTKKSLTSSFQRP